MLGFLVFYRVWGNLGEECRNKVLGNIFGIDAVSVASVFVGNKDIIFRLFSKGVFYQYIFVVGSGKNKVLSGKRFVQYMIFSKSDKFRNFNEFIYHLVQCQEELEVYKLVKKFL